MDYPVRKLFEIEWDLNKPAGDAIHQYYNPSSNNRWNLN
jgi:hypothetical protein